MFSCDSANLLCVVLRSFTDDALHAVVKCLCASGLITWRNQGFIKCRQQPVLVSQFQFTHHLCDLGLQSWLFLNDDPQVYRLQKWKL